MTDQRAADTTPLNPPDVPVEDMRRELAGDEPRADQDGILSTDQVELPSTMSGGGVTADMAGAAGSIPRVASAESLELLEDRALRTDETTDANTAAEGGIPWVPPVDPPVVPSSDPQG